MWAGAGISSLSTNSSLCIPTSVYSLPMTLVEHVGGWDTGPGAIGEDMHMYLKCFFALSGNLKARIVYSAASQCDVSSDLKGFAGYMDGLNARYKQALRHMWGSMDSGYAVRQSLEMINRHYRALQPKCEGPLSVLELIMYAKDALLIVMSTVCSSNWTAFHRSHGLHKSLISKPVASEPPSLKPIHQPNICTLFHRLFEAHFLPCHLAIILATSTIFQITYGPASVPRELALALQFSAICRHIGWFVICVFFWRYEKYHRLCVSLRQEEMRKAGLLQNLTEGDGFSPNAFITYGILEAALFPIGGFVYGAMPAFQAMLCHLFTDRLTYHVSLKPQFAIRRWRGGSG